MQPWKFGFVFSASVTGKFTSVPYDAALEERARRENLVLRAPVLANQAAKIAKTLAAAERPERLLAEEQRDRRVLRRRRRQRRASRPA